MKLLFAKSKWEAGNWPMETFLSRVAEEGFDATEINISGVSDSPEVVRQLHAKHGLKLLAQLTPGGATPEEHWKKMEELFLRTLEFEPLRINSHTGSDLFSFEDNLRIFEKAIALAQRHGVAWSHETHRGRALYSAVESRKYLQALPGLRLTADFSHWMVVHESDLSNQPDNMDAAITRADHIHGRVGFPEGPQVNDPRSPEHEKIVQRHVDLWRRILAMRKQEGVEYLAVTPEFGPPQYMPTLPHTGKPVADTWEVNCYFRKFLKDALAD